MKPNEWFERKLSEARETIENKTEKVKEKNGGE